MCENNNLDLQKLVRENIEGALEKVIEPVLDINKQYNLTIVYDNSLTGKSIINVIGTYKGSKIPKVILSCFDELEIEIDNFGVIAQVVKSDLKKHWEIFVREPKNKE